MHLKRHRGTAQFLQVPDPDTAERNCIRNLFPIPATGPNPINSTPNGISSPTHLTHICRKWRRIVLATPALCRAIGLSDADIPFSRQDHWPEAWLSRSGACHLSIAIDNCGSCILLKTIAAAIVARQARFQQLGLCIHLSSIAKIAGPMSLVRWLDLLVLDHRSNSYVFAFRDAPLLRIVALRGFVTSIVTLAWDKLTCLILSGVEPERCVIILQQTTRLIECTMYFNKDHVALEDHLDVVLPCLQSLIMEIWCVVSSTPSLPPFSASSKWKRYSLKQTQSSR